MARIPRCMRLWCRPAATAPIGPLAWEPLCAAGAALKKERKEKKKKERERERKKQAQIQRTNQWSVVTSGAGDNEVPTTLYTIKKLQGYTYNTGTIANSV